MVGGLRPGRQADGAGADRLGHLGQQRRPAGRRPRRRPSRRGARRPPVPCRRRRPADGTPPTWVPAAMAGARTSAPSAPLVWTIAWPLYSRTRRGERRERVVRDGHDDQLDLLDEGLRLGEGPRAAGQPGQALAAGRGRGWRRPGPASRPGSGRAPSAVPTAPPPTMPGGRALTGPGVLVGMGVAVGVDLVAVAVVARRDRIEVDAGGLDGRLGLGADRAPGRRPAACPTPSSARRPRRSGGRGTLPRIECSEPARSDALSIHQIPSAPGRPSVPGLPDIYRLDALGGRTGDAPLPVTVRILLENVLRHAGGPMVTAGDVETLARLAARASRPRPRSRSCPRGSSSRTSPACRRSSTWRSCATRWPTSAATRPGSIRSCRPTSSSTTASRSTGSGRRPPSPSTSSASTSATASATSSCAGPRPRSATCASCRPGPASSTRSTSSSWPRSSTTRDGVAFPDTLVGTDSHTTMINGLGVLGYGVGGIEAEAVLLGQPLYQPMPHVVGVRLTGELPRGSTATDLVLVVTEMLRRARRGRRVRRVRRRRPGRPVPRRPGDDQQHEPRVRGDRDALPDRRRDARLPAPDRPDRPSGSTSSSATPRSRACGASPATARTSTRC